MLTGLKEGLSLRQAERRAKAAMREAARTMGIETAGELVEPAQSARAKHIADTARPDSLSDHSREENAASYP
ncbi:hypothetical protein [Streptomyces violascens]|uniref:Uncharacterized protein n=1 Tax=Streptomyces violascens TaxID=67381 RepID=A0ABQ3QS54_9ACTN|nr:hypothetical protein [Streptomyces violascens]GHI40068.1 hypothetical protein Sviol_44760 [Streptomyces violascens]